MLPCPVSAIGAVFTRSHIHAPRADSAAKSTSAVNASEIVSNITASLGERPINERATSGYARDADYNLVL